MLPNCKQVAEQLSDDLDQSFTGMKWFKLKVHLLMCKHCSRYQQQLKLSTKTINLMEPKILPSEALKEKVLSYYQQEQAQKEQGNQKLSSKDSD